jgi:aryl carrier-like protein
MMAVGEGTGYRRIGERLMAAGFLTEEQRNAVLTQQEAFDARGQHVRFGELAVQMGFCTHEQVETLPGYLGDRLVAAGLLSGEQRALLITWQEKLREKGIHIRFGDLATSEGICSAAQIETIITAHADSTTRH